MGNLFLTLTIFVFCLASNYGSFAQCFDPDFTDPAFAPCSAASQGSCGTINDCNGWYRLQGSPQIDPYSITISKDNRTITAYYIYLWSGIDPNLNNQLDAEGVFTATPFLAHHSYDIKLGYSSY